MKKLNLAVLLFALLLAAACKKNENGGAHEFEIEPASVATWKGFLRTGYFNEGTIAVEAENLRIANGKVKSGTFHMPLSSLINLNLPAEQKPVLIHHLQSSDFFNMALHPEVTFQIQKTETYNGHDASGANVKLTGLLTILGKPLPVTVPAKIAMNGNTFTVLSKFKIDRTKWGMNFASDPNLPDDAYILPEIEISLDIKGTRK